MQQKEGKRASERRSRSKATGRNSLPCLLAADLMAKNTRPRVLSLSPTPLSYLETPTQPCSSGTVLRPLERVPDPAADGAHAERPADIVKDAVRARLALVVDRGATLLRRGRGGCHLLEKRKDGSLASRCLRCVALRR